MDTKALRYIALMIIATASGFFVGLVVLRSFAEAWIKKS